MTVTYSCERCAWSGPQPSWSDTSSKPEADTAPGSVHIAICPRCFSDAIAVEMAAAAETLPCKPSDGPADGAESPGLLLHPIRRGGEVLEIGPEVSAEELRLAHDFFATDE